MLICGRIGTISREDDFAIQREFAVLSVHYRTVYIELEGKCSMRRFGLILIAGLLAVGCSDSDHITMCDLWTGRAIVAGTVRDLDGEVVRRAEVRVWVSIYNVCDPNYFFDYWRCVTDTTGRYELLIEMGNTGGTHCVQGQAVGSDSISNALAEFTNPCIGDVSIESTELDLILRPSNSVCSCRPPLKRLGD